MTNPDGLKLVSTDDTQRDSIPFERRVATRHTLSGRVTALQFSGDQGTSQHKKICSLQLLNISDTGLGAVTDEPVALQTPITVFFPPHGPEAGFDAVGHVVRCQANELGHELGIRFDGKAAA